MAVLHRALFTWFTLLIFLVLLVLKLDQKIQWNWFIVFVPMWLYDSILFIYIVFNMIIFCKNAHDHLISPRRMVWYTIAVLLKLSAQFLVCLKLEATQLYLPFKIVLAPLGLLFAAFAADITKLIQHVSHILKLMFIKLILPCLCLMMAKHGMVKASVSVTEVRAGELAELPCLSSDDFHRFMFWQLSDDSHIIGPGNPVDEQKYNYEVLTGKLYIRAVSTAEAGFYKCVSRGVEDNSAINIHTVELIVKKDFEGLMESSFETNLLRGMAVTMVLVVGIAVTLVVIIMRRRKNHRFFDVMEESRENSPAKYVGTMPSAPVTASPRSLEAGGIDNMGLDVDFPKVFQQMQARPMQ